MRLLEIGRKSPRELTDRTRTQEADDAERWHLLHDLHVARYGDESRPEALELADEALARIEPLPVRRPLARRGFLVALVAAAAVALGTWSAPAEPEASEPPPSPLPQPAPSYSVLPPGDEHPFTPPRLTMARVDVRDRHDALPDADVYLVPVGRVEPGLLERSARRLGAQLRLRIAVRPAVDAPTRRAAGDILDWVAVLERVDRAVPTARFAGGSTVIGVTELALGDPPDGVYFMGEDSGLGTVAVSTAPLDPENYGYEADPALRDARLRKLLLRAIGFRHLGLRPSDDPSSPIAGHFRHDVETVDLMRDELRGVSPST